MDVAATVASAAVADVAGGDARVDAEVEEEGAASAGNDDDAACAYSAYDGDRH